MLSKERIAELKMYFTRCVQSRSLSTVVHLAECGLELIEMVEALQQENEQLRAQVVKLQEVLRGIEKEYVNDFTDEELDEGLCSRDNAILNYWVRPVLNYGTVDYHNPADVEALRKAREVLYNLRMDDYPGFSAICEALAEIDKVMGGKEDV